MGEHRVWIPLELAYECRDQLRRANAEHVLVRRNLGNIGYVPKYDDRRPYGETLRKLTDAIGDDEPTPLPGEPPRRDTDRDFPAVTAEVQNRKPDPRREP